MNDKNVTPMFPNDPTEMLHAYTVRDIEGKTRAQLLDLVEATMPMERVDATKRLVDTILKGLVQRMSTNLAEIRRIQG